MNSKIYEIIPENPDQRYINTAVSILKEGGVICYPTDTVYGLGASILGNRAIERINHIKRLANKKLLSLICKDLKEIAHYTYVSNQSYKIMRRCLPGAYTFILPATSQTPKRLFQKRRTVGVRVPDNRLCQVLVETLGLPLINTSVPAGADEILNDPYEIDRRIGHELDLIFDGGILLSEPSTIVDLTDAEPQVIREGAGDISLIY